MNTRGQAVILDLIVNMIYIFIIAMFIVTAVFFHKTVTQETEIYSATATGQEIQASIDTTVNMYSFIFVMCLASILVSLIISAHYIETSVVFAIVGIAIVIITVMVSAPISNAFHELTADPDLSPKLTDHTLITSLMDNFPLINLMFGSIFVIVLYVKKRRTEGTFNPPI